MRKMLFTCVALALGFAVSGHAIVLIDADTNNGSFEYADGVLNTAKIKHWDTDPVGDVDNWTAWYGPDHDSGVENTGYASEGTMVAFLQPENAVHNMTSWVIQEGDIFDFSWDHVRREVATHSAGLVWDNAGTVEFIAPSLVATGGLVLETLSGSYTVQAGDAWIGSTVGFGFVNDDVTWPEVDNVLLDVVPEPSTLVLFGLFGGLVALRRRFAK